MKKTCLLLLLLCLCASLSARTYVLVTGVSRYEDEANNLRQTTKDAESFRKVMLKQTKDVTILTSKYANHDNILQKYRTIANRAKEGDRIVFYFSGHGSPGCIRAYDRKILYDELVTIAHNSKASEKVFFIDACHAGSVADNSNSYQMQGKEGMIFFMSSRADEFSQESSIIGASTFTQAIVKGLLGKSDTNGDRKVTVMELFQYAYTDVVNRSSTVKQHPQLIAPKGSLESVIANW